VTSSSYIKVCLIVTLLWVWVVGVANLQASRVALHLVKGVAKSSLLARGRYGWVARDVRTQYSLFKWSQLLESWLMCIRVLERGVSSYIISLEHVSGVDNLKVLTFNCDCTLVKSENANKLIETLH